MQLKVSKGFRNVVYAETSGTLRIVHTFHLLDVMAGFLT